MIKTISLGRKPDKERTDMINHAICTEIRFDYDIGFFEHVPFCLFGVSSYCSWRKTNTFKWPGLNSLWNNSDAALNARNEFQITGPTEQIACSGKTYCRNSNKNADR